MTKRKSGTLPGKEPATAPPAGKTVPPALPVGEHSQVGEKDPPVDPGAEPDPRILALRELADWILRGENEIAIREAIKAKFPLEDADELLALAFTYIGELAGTDPALRRTWHVAARRELYRRTVEIHDFKTARDILRDLAQLEGLYPKMAPTKSTKAGDQADTQAGPGDGIPTADGFPVQ